MAQPPHPEKIGPYAYDLEGATTHSRLRAAVSEWWCEHS